MQEDVILLQRHISAQYERCLGENLLVGGPEILKGSAAAVCWQDADLNHVSEEEQARGALLVDPEVGLCLFFQSFDAQTDIHSQISKSLRLRSQLQPSRGVSESDVDELGEWRVCLHWLVEQHDFDKWVDHVSGLRQETAHFEEVPVDAIVNWEDDWDLSFKRHGLPRMLLHTRDILRKGNYTDAMSWANADKEIGDKVREIPNRAETNLQKRYAEQLLNKLDELQGQGQILARDIESAPELRSLHIENFRNIKELDLELRNQNELVSSNVIQGPNGSGKSSVYEAISLSLSGVSGRYLEFIRDTNITSKKTSESYLRDYLTPLWGGKESPMQSRNGEIPETIRLLAPDLAVEAARELRGTFLSQSFSDSLLDMKADNLGAEVTGDYSEVASALYEFCDQNLERSQKTRSEFIRGWGLNANISKAETAKARMAERIVSRSFPYPDQFSRWCNSTAFKSIRSMEPFRNLGVEWENLRQKQSELINRLSGLDGQTEIAEAIDSFSESYQDLCDRSQSMLSEISHRQEALYDNLPEAISSYGTWLISDTEHTEEGSAETADLNIEIRLKSEQLAKLIKDGTALKARAENIQRAIDVYDRELGDLIPSNCPTCDTDLSNRGGVLKTLSDVLRETESELTLSRESYRVTQKERSVFQEKLARTSGSTPPINPDELSTLQVSLGTLFGGDIDLANFIDAEDTLRSLLSAVEQMRRPPTGFDFSLGAGQRDQAAPITTELHEAFRHFQEVSEAPEAWSTVRKFLLNAFIEAMLEHLPRTVQALWLELSQNMMPARWQYPGEARFDVEQRRGRAEARVVVRGAENSPLARHILNGAEVHNLALSWFFVRYLTSGRFRYRFMILDDPAQQMDQPTFRDLCRLLEALLRLHRRHSIPLTLIVLLHQDERALDAARATNGTLHLLRWNRDTPSLKRSIKIRDKLIASPNAYACLTD
tara:strand:+ start:2961 stop:5795 length:2835 start_codon:yes stop_codon:yes gene_type:complete